MGGISPDYSISQKKVRYGRHAQASRNDGLTPPLRIIELSIRPELNIQLVPDWRLPELEDRGIDLNNFTPIPLEELRITLD